MFVLLCFFLAISVLHLGYLFHFNTPQLAAGMETSQLTVETMKTSPLTVETMKTSSLTVETMKTSSLTVVKITDLYP